MSIKIFSCDHNLLISLAAIFNKLSGLNDSQYLNRCRFTVPADLF